ncbi:hypothetical protein [Gordonia neofelifaecis]|uniref:SCP domain-containing protein n=1 Tax=Gordonia neofelifaecis NRRL B-59395 TaxID=644548 RepID=F1YFH9_9ACTN|nr:hypothetical protein [Gordonia neofelifaecis]EGD56467.1 hypothetical protein SCNU_02912 [Gordonia neofelifaecis NRRL B-59395]
MRSVRIAVLAVLMTAILALTSGVIAWSPASAAPADCTTLQSDIQAYNGDANSLASRISAHNARQGSVNTRDVGAVNAYNAEADQLDGERSALKARAGVLRSRAAQCGSGDQVRDVPSMEKPGQPNPQRPQNQQNPRPSTPAVPQTPKLDVEKRNAPMHEKVQDAAYRQKYYRAQDSNGVMYRRNAGARDANGEPIPRIYEDRSNPGTFKLASNRPVEPAQYKSVERPTPVSPRDTQSVASALKKRRDANADVKRFQADEARETANGGKISNTTADKLRDAYARQTRHGEELGEAAGRQSIARDFPSSKYDVRELTNPNARGGQGTFDQVYSVKPKAGGPERIVINEAKGPSAGLGQRRGWDSKDYQQGTRGYLELVLQDLLKTNFPLATRIGMALNNGTLDYRMVQAVLTKTGEWGGFTVKVFQY